MAQQTAVEWLADKLNKEEMIIYHGLFDMWIKQAKQMEKEQIMKSYKDYHDLGHIYGIDTEQYYNETFGGNNEQ